MTGVVDRMSKAGDVISCVDVPPGSEAEVETIGNCSGECRI